MSRQFWPQYIVRTSINFKAWGLSDLGKAKDRELWGTVQLTFNQRVRSQKASSGISRADVSSCAKEICLAKTLGSMLRQKYLAVSIFPL